MNDELIIPDEPSFDCPEGCYSGTLYTVKKIKNRQGSIIKVRPIFLVDIPPSPGETPKTYMAGRFYEAKLHKGSPLREDMEAWLGTDYFDRNRAKAFDWDEHIGRKADLMLAHTRSSPKHQKPFVDVVLTKPPGTLSTTKHHVV